MAKLALLIGVSEYQPGLNPLPAAVRDVIAMQRLLESPDVGGFDKVKAITNPDSQKMREEIETLFEARSRDDLILLFFSGHGVKDDAGNLFFAARNTKKNEKGILRQSTAVAATFVQHIMNGSRAKRQAIILDCCFSGAFDPALQTKDDNSVDLQTQLGAEGRVVLTSSSSTQYSFETQGSELSLYTRYLVEGIETGAGDQNSDGYISILELHEYAARKVRETAPKMTPKIIVMKDKGFEIRLAKATIKDPKLRYRQKASQYIESGKIRPASRAVLDTLRQRLNLTVEEATVIENELFRPYKERLANLQRYREALTAEAEHEYPLNQAALEDLQELQKMFGLRNEDIVSIEQEIEVQFIQRAKAYQANLAQYEQLLSNLVKQEFPLRAAARQELKDFQQARQLKNEDIAKVEKPLLKRAAEHQRKSGTGVVPKQHLSQSSQFYGASSSKPPSPPPPKNAPTPTSRSRVANPVLPTQQKAFDQGINWKLWGIGGGTSLIVLLAMITSFNQTEPSQSEQVQPVSPDKTLEVIGDVLIDGSSNVFPIAEAMSEEFSIINPDVRLTVGVSGSGGGLKKFCAGETDISNASRPIKEREVIACAEAGIEFIEVPIAFDALAIVTNRANDWAQCLTVEQLNIIWSPDSEGQVANWNQVDASFPDQELGLYGPGTDSGTFDYFTDEVNGEEGASRGDYTASEDDNVIVNGVTGDQGALGYFGYAYFEENSGSLKAVEIENDAGVCVAPSRETIADGSYNPMSRPLFFYVKKDAYDTKPQVKAFVDFMLDPKNVDLVVDVGYIPLPDSILANSRARIDEGKLGTDPTNL